MMYSFLPSVLLYVLLFSNLAFFFLSPLPVVPSSYLCVCCHNRHTHTHTHARSSSISLRCCRETSESVIMVSWIVY